MSTWEVPSGSLPPLTMTPSSLLQTPDFFQMSSLKRAITLYRNKEAIIEYNSATQHGADNIATP